MLSLADLIHRAKQTPLYKDWDFSNVSTFGDPYWQHLPTLSKDDLRNFPVLHGDENGLLMFFSSGTTGTPKMVGYSKADLERIGELCARFAKLEGITPQSRVMVLLPMALWSVGKITIEGHMRLGAQVFPVDLHGGIPLWQYMADLIRPTVISSTPSVLAAWAMEYHGPRLQLVETTGEPLLIWERQVIEARFGAFVHDSYGLSECVVGVECRVRNGFHFWEDAVGIEIVDPETKKTLEHGQVGEIVVTSFMQEHVPIIRYRTGDLGYIVPEPCPCGRQLPKLKLKGRLGKNTVILPRAVKLEEEVLTMALEEVGAKGTFVWKSKPENPASLYLKDQFKPTLEIQITNIEKTVSMEYIEKHILKSIPDLSELVFEKELRLVVS